MHFVIGEVVVDVFAKKENERESLHQKSIHHNIPPYIVYLI